MVEEDRDGADCRRIPGRHPQAHEQNQQQELAEANSAILNMALEHILREFTIARTGGPASFRTGPAPGTSAAAGMANMPESFAEMRWCRLNAEGFIGINEDIHGGKDYLSPVPDKSRIPGAGDHVSGGAENGQNGTCRIIETSRTDHGHMALERPIEVAAGLWNQGRRDQDSREYGQKPWESCALMLLDMDNFTRINQEGVAFANAVLRRWPISCGLRRSRMI